MNSSKYYHQERDTELRRLSKDVAAACGAVSLRFHGDSNLPKSNPRYLRIGTTKDVRGIKVLTCGFGERYYGGWRS